MVWRAIGRIILVPLGFVLASLAAMFILVTLGMARVTHAIHGRDADPDTWFAMFDLAQQTILLFSTFTVVPAILLVIIGEVARIRSSLYYILGGGAVLAAWPFLSRLGNIAQDPSQLGIIWQVFATAGFAGGFIYWLIAGRRA
ncbi:MAG: hypothetical protein J0J14_07710 [Hyphomicrobium sp.]|nr:hypothetical protein [Hyphomicrobium sp.]